MKVTVLYFSFFIFANLLGLQSLQAQRQQAEKSQQGAQASPIAQEELQSAIPTEFVNYTGPHARIDSLEAIIAIGSSLAASLDDTTDYGGKYTLRRIAGNGNLFAADILSLSPLAEVDHIRNLRHILAGYLQEQYGYSAEAAATISIFLTYYNAFYRQNAEYFQQKFSPGVNAALAALGSSTIGLSTNYTEWPGATQIVIPLSATLGQASSPDLDETGQDSVSEYLAQEETDAQAAQEIRQDMLDLRQEQLRQDQEILDQEQSNLQTENRNAQADLEKALATEASTDDLAEREAAQQEKKDLEEEIQKNRREQDERNAVQQVIAQRQENLSQDQRTLKEESQAENQQELLFGDTQVVLLPRAGKAERSSETSNFYQLYAIDTATLRIAKKSPMNSIRSRDIVASEVSYTAVAGEDQRSRRIRLIQLNAELEETGQGSNDIHPESGVWQHEGWFYAFLADGTLGRFDGQLKLQDQSAEILVPTVIPQFIQSHIILQNPAKRFVILDSSNLQQTVQALE